MMTMTKMMIVFMSLRCCSALTTTYEQAYLILELYLLLSAICDYPRYASDSSEIKENAHPASSTNNARAKDYYNNQIMTKMQERKDEAMIK
jgi:hypothetical protein